MKFEDMIDKPIEEMSDEEIAELVNKLSVPEVARLERAVLQKVIRKKRKPNKDVELFNKIVEGGDASK